MPQIALNWLLQRPTVSTVIIGARNEEQLRQNLGAVGWNLTPEQVASARRRQRRRRSAYPVLAPGAASPSGTRRRCEGAGMSHRAPGLVFPTWTDDGPVPLS